MTIITSKILLAPTVLSLLLLEILVAEAIVQPSIALRPLSSLTTTRPSPTALPPLSQASPPPALVILRTPEERPLGSIVSANLFREPAYTRWAESLQANDGASGRLQTCNLNSVVFALDAQTGALSLKQRLDREALLPGRRPDFVSAVDRVGCEVGAASKAAVGERGADECYVESACMAMRGNRLHALTVRLYVDDVNDNAPSWLGNDDQTHYVVENTHPTVRLSPASDPDSGPNGTIRYSIVSSTNTTSFSIDECVLPKSACGGALIVRPSRPFDFEETPEHEFTVIASDEGSPPLTSSARVRIRITDQNDNSPRFPQPLLVLNVREDSAPRKFLGSFYAEDADAMDRTLFYRLVPGSNFLAAPSHSAQQHPANELFAVENSDEVGGELFLVGQLDFERQKRHVLLVEALDSMRTHTASMTIQVLVLHFEYSTVQYSQVQCTEFNHVKSAAHIGKVQMQAIGD